MTKVRHILLAVICLMAVMPLAAKQPKYIFFMIGDGMGMTHIAATEMYYAELDGFIGRKPLCVTQFPYTGYATTFSASNGITCSSAAGTALATGNKTNNGVLGLNPDGKELRTIAENLHDRGWSVGLMTSVSIDHATPAAFYANVSSRNDYYAVGRQLAETKFEFFGGGTFYQPYLKDKPTEPNVYARCRENGYRFFHGYDEFKDKGMGCEKAILIQKHEGLTDDYLGEGRIPYAIDRQEGDLTLEQITTAAIKFLYDKNRPFFMMIEGGQIDWASHSNDAATIIQETLDFDMAIRQAYLFYLEHPDETLIIVTADHETGGFALGNYKYVLNLQLLQNQKASVWAISEHLKQMQKEYGKKLRYEQVKELFSATLGLYNTVEVTKEEDAELQKLFKQMMQNKATDSKNLYASLNALSDKAMRLLNKKANIGWTTGSHSGTPVPVFAIGVGAEQFVGMYDNTDIPKKIMKIAYDKK